MEEKRDGGKKARRIFTAEQKFEILKDLERCKTIKEGLTKHQLGQSLYPQMEVAAGCGSAGVVTQ